ncbi:hypothetical protein [Synechococcus sp. CCY 0621]|uniref:hypothetical protein n=1 Tax=Synechococcus sp. CCY 0621 TaxID=2815603 RepID=UPI001C21CBFA|nr:hypothetical protein [Synechococcus sp. CCY 0621]
MNRPRAEHCSRITAGAIRAQVQPGDVSSTLTDGSPVELRWGAVRGCFGGKGGKALVLLCPSCARPCRVLWLPPAQSWGCCQCRPVSHRSHRRPGARAGRLKPAAWDRLRIAQEQSRIADLLGLQQWPPRRLCWGLSHLADAKRRPDAPRLSWVRRDALMLRLSALETLRVVTFLSEGSLLPKAGFLEGEGQRLAAKARPILMATAWALRRPGHDPRTLRR